MIKVTGPIPFQVTRVGSTYFVRLHDADLGSMAWDKLEAFLGVHKCTAQCVETVGWGHA